MAKSNNQIIIFDTTLRDGEQSPGASMSLEEKIQIARAFEDLGVDVMEAGFPAASNGDFEAVSEIAKILKKTIPCGLARAVKADIERCKDALKHAKRFRIHTFLSTSALHMKHKLKKTPKEVLELIKDSVSLARRFTDDVEWSPEDGTRTTPDFLCKTVELAIKCGARTINIPDTVGYTIPDEYYKTIKLLFDKFSYKFIININPNNYEANYALGLLYLNSYLKDKKQSGIMYVAKYYLTKANEIDPYELKSLTSLSLLYKHTGEITESQIRSIDCVDIFLLQFMQ